MTKADSTAVTSPEPYRQPDQTPTNGPTRHWFWIVWLVVSLLVVGLTILIVVRIRAGSTAAAASRRDLTGGKGIPVDAATAQRGDLPIYVDGLLGTVTPLQTVTIHTRVDGQLIKVAFDEGQIVHQGDLLAEIDPNPFKAVLEQAQGQLAKDQASLTNDQLNLKRFKDAPDAYTQQQIDTQQASVDQDDGVINSDQGTVDTAQVNLDYCTIKSPVTGRIGLRQVDQGNIVHAADTNGLAVITQLQPITIVFPIQQRCHSQTSSAIQNTIPPLKTLAMYDDQVLATGKLIAVDSQSSATQREPSTSKPSSTTPNTNYSPANS